MKKIILAIAVVIACSSLWSDIFSSSMQGAGGGSKGDPGPAGDSGSAGLIISGSPLPNIKQDLSSPGMTDFRSGHPYPIGNKVGTATVTDDATVHLNGSQSLKFATAGDGTETYATTAVLSPTLDLTNKVIVLKARVSDASEMATMKVQFSSDDFSSNYSYFFSGPTTYWRDNEWATLTLGVSDRFNFGLVSGDSTINRIRITVADKGNSAVNFNIASLGIMDRASKTIVCVTFDDAHESIYLEGKKYMAKYGMPATLYTIQESIDTTNHLTLAQLHELQDFHGWQISAHGFTDLSTLSISAAEADIVLQKQFLLDNGFHGAEFFAWPLGIYNEALMQMAKKYFRFMRGTSVGNESFPAGDWRSVRSKTVTSTTTPAFVQGLIDKAITNNDFLSLLFHIIQDPIGGQTTYLPADFATIIDYIETKRVAGDLKVLTVQDAMLEYMK